VRITAVIQSVPARKALVRRLESQLERSDLDGFKTLVQHAEHDPWDHFFAVFKAMLSEDSDLVIRFEDDALVGPHIKHNCVTWPVIHRPEFGSGWLYSPPFSIRDYIYRKRLKNPNPKRRFAGSVAVLFWRKDLEWIMEAARKWVAKKGVGYAYDFCISEVIFNARRENWLHDPPIVEHDRHTASAFGHPRTPRCSTLGLSKLNYYRAH
jgi:hypothetical protein